MKILFKYLLIIASCIIFPPAVLIYLTAILIKLYRRHWFEKNLWACKNPELARAKGIEPDYVTALNLNGMAGFYLNLTKKTANPLLEKYNKDLAKLREEHEKEKERILAQVKPEMINEAFVKAFSDALKSIKEKRGIE